MKKKIKRLTNVDVIFVKLIFIDLVLLNTEEVKNIWTMNNNID